MATEQVYSDFPLSFTSNPFTGDITPLSDARSVKNALLNLLRTPIGSRPFYPEYGTNIERYIFDPGDALTESELNEEIATSIQRFEPRVKLVSIETSMQDYGVDVKVDYFIINVPGQQTLETTLTRTS